MTVPELPIESGATGEWKTRIGIFLAMCLAFSLWFAKDGFISYPHKNLESARQALPVKTANLKQNSQATGERLKLAAEKSSGKAGMKIADLHALLGEPSLEQNKQYTFVGPTILATAQVADGKITSIDTKDVAGQRPESPSFRVTPEQVKNVSVGMTEEELIRFLGEPAKKETRRVWYVGPAGYASFEVDDQNLTHSPPPAVESGLYSNIRLLEPSEGDIFIQKVLSGILALLTIFVGIKWIRILAMKVRLDEKGLTFNGRPISWDQMTGIETDQYLDKGWLDLVYTADGQEDVQRLDSYHIDKFRDIVRAICDRKGFTLPTASITASSAKTDSPAVEEI